MGAILEIQGLTKYFRHQWTMRRFCALAGLDLRIDSGEIFGIIGPNGAGKTTTFKLILGLLRPTSGTVAFRGEPLTTGAHAAIGFLPEQPYFYEYLTVAESLSLYAQLYGLHGAGQRRRVAEVIEQVQLGHKRRASLRSLSKGTLQRVGIAQAILNRPQLLILDEPMSGLDPTGRYAMRELIHALLGTGTTVMFSSHILPDAEALCDRVGIVSEGRLREVIDLRGTQFAQAYRLTVRSIGSDTLAEIERLAGSAPTANGAAWSVHLPGPDAVAAALDLVRGAAGLVESLVPVYLSLEERFLAHVGSRASLD